VGSNSFKVMLAAVDPCGIFPTVGMIKFRMALVAGLAINSAIVESMLRPETDGAMGVSGGVDAVGIAVS